MNTLTWSGNGTSQSITGVNFSPDFVWIKKRNAIGYHILQDTIRGAGKNLFSNDTLAEIGNAGDLISSFNTNGFTVNTTYNGGTNGATNGSGDTFVGWSWRGSDSSPVSNTDGTITSTVSANTTSGFSIVTWTGDGGSNQSVGHGLSEQPDMVIVKKRNKAENWYVASTSSGYDTNFGYHLHLNTTGAVEGNNDPYYLNSIGSVADKLLLSNGTSNNGGNENGINYVAYCWHSVDGYSKIGSYTGNGSADGTFVYTGFKPAFVILKNANASRNWLIIDTARSTYNQTNHTLEPNTSNTENPYDDMDILSNGFKMRTTDPGGNGNGQTIIYMAFAENPFKHSLAR
jgi:hypothetical protein